MAELAISAASSILIELAVSTILEKHNDKKNVKKEVQSVKNWLETIQAYVEANREHRGANRRLDVKVEQVREIAFEIEDVLDEIFLHSTHVFRSSKITKMASKLGHDIRHLFPLNGIPEKIANINKKIEDIKSQAVAFPDDRSSLNLASGAGSSVGHRVSPLLRDNEMAGYTNLKETFMSRLTDRETGLITLAVVGPAGSGKTTFIKNMFWKPKIRGRFDCHAWVLVSKEFDLKALFTNMLKQFCSRRKESYNTLDISEILTQLRKYLENRRYIIVLDDIWKKEHWDCVKNALPNGRAGSRIVVSTRFSNIASSCASSPQFVYELKGLESLDAWSLFCRIAFKESNGECPAELKTCSWKILTRCEGLPFAIVAVASALAQKPKLPNEWEKFHRSLEYETEGDLSTISNTLLPGYLDLSCNLKSCFLYFGLFPEDYSVERGRLLRLWVAERFVTGTGSRTPEEVAEYYLDELIHRNLVHVSNWDFDGRPRSCRVLSFVLTFIVQKCKEEIFASVFPRENTSASDKIRRLSVHGDCSHLPRNIQFAVIRSFSVYRCRRFSPAQLGNNFLEFKLLRVLDLQGVPDLTEFPQHITRLILLRYLSLRATDIKTIPKSIKKLVYLTTLDLRQTGVKQLPDKISRLSSLRHLFVYKHNVDYYEASDSMQGVEIFEGIGNLTNLQKLSLVEVSRKDGMMIRELEKLTQLRKLGLVGIRKEHGRALCESLEQLKNLTTLDLCSKSEDEFLEVREIRTPILSIQRLYLKGRLREFPGWISKLDNLQRIGLKWSKSKDCPLKALGHLPNLMEIELLDSFVGGELVFEASTFKKLKILVIEKLSCLNTVVIEEGAMPELEKMNLRQCHDLMMLPLGIHNLSKIEELILHDMAAEFVARFRHSEDRQIVQHIPVIHSFTLGNQGWALENLSGSFFA